MSDLPSYRKVNYAIRPAKNIERKMIAEACSRLGIFGQIGAYRYVGFGSTYFSDFTLFHKVLGITNMISIEREVVDAERFDFNKPLGCITLEFGESSEVLSRLSWKEIPTIIWLDYDSALDLQKLSDLHYLATDLAPSSAIIVTVEADARDLGEHKDRVGMLRESLGGQLPLSISLRDVSQRRFSIALRDILVENIGEALSRRNAALPESNRIEFHQMFNFIYNDGTPMFTLGGVFIQKHQTPQLQWCDFESLDYCMSGSERFEIVAPNLTYKEQRHLNAQLPSQDAASPGVTQEEVAAYSKVYRYFPTFAEAEL